MSFSLYDLIFNLVSKKNRRLPWDFNSRAYRAYNPDVTLSGFYARKHYQKIGRFEGRIWQAQILSGLPFDKQKKTIALIVDLKRSTSSHIEDCIEKFSKKYNVALIARCDDGNLNEYQKHCFKILLSPTIDGSFFKRIKVVRFIKTLPNLQYTVVDYHENDKIVYRLWKNAVPTVLMLNGRRLKSAPTIFRSLFGATRVVCSSQQVLDDLAYSHLWGYPDQTAVLAPSVIDFNKKDNKQNNDDLLILGAGIPDYFSGIDIFIEVAHKIKQAELKRNVRFLWVEFPGSQEKTSAFYPNLEHLIGRYNLQNILSLVKADTLLPALLKNADIFLDTSRYENAAHAGMQAMASGLPIITSNEAKPLADILSGAQLADDTIVDGYDSKSFFEKLKHVILSNQLLDIGQEILKAASALTTAEGYANRIDEIGCAASLQMQQEQKDLAYIRKNNGIDVDYWFDHSKRKNISKSLAYNYVRGWKSGTTPRRPFAGFHPGIYAEHNDLGVERIDPTVHFLKNGKPEGPWKWDVIRDVDAISNGALQQRVALQIHTYYPDMLPDIMQRLNFNKIRPDLYISVKDEAAKSDVEAILSDYPKKVDIRIVPNCGRDIGPLLTEFGSELTKNYDIIGHLHTKKSFHVKDRAYLEKWTKFLMNNLLGDANSIAVADTIIEKMAQDKDVALVFSDDRNAVSWAKNYASAKQLAPKLGCNELPHFIIFPVGTMFWARASLLQNFVDLNLQWQDYPAEPLANDGTILHGIERLLGVVAIFEKKKISTILMPDTIR